MMDAALFQKWRPKTCKDRSSDLDAGIGLIGRRLVGATELSHRLTSSQGPARGTRARDAMIAAMLTWERSLVEFVLAPVRITVDGINPLIGLRYLRENICPWYFDIPWRLEDDDPALYETINKRWHTISRHLAHASWKEACSPRRFEVSKISNVADALDRFANALAEHGDQSDALAEHLRRDLETAKTIASDSVADRSEGSV